MPKIETTQAEENRKQKMSTTKTATDVFLFHMMANELSHIAKSLVTTGKAKIAADEEMINAMEQVVEQMEKSSERLTGSGS